MPISRIDAGAALVVVDLQRGTTAYPTAHPIQGVVDRATRLAAAFRRQGRPVVLVRFDPGLAAPGRTEVGGGLRDVPASFAELVPGLAAPEGEGPDVVVTKGGWSAFVGTGLADRLRGLAVGQVVIVGVATTFGVESTARHAYDEGFHVVSVVDAITGPDLAAHDMAVSGVFRVLGETGSTDEVLGLLGG